MHICLTRVDDECSFETAAFEAVDLASIDAVLISNHLALLGLPYITEVLAAGR
jgi:hypothetical protein